LKYISPLLFIAGLCCAALPRGAQAAARTATSADIEVKVSLESLLEKRLETVLRKVLGIDDVTVVANAELLADAERPDVEVMPGVVVKKTPSTPAPMELPTSIVRRITISVFVPHSLSDENLELARKTAERMVGIRPERGDVLNVERVGVPPAPPAAPLAPHESFLDQTLRPTNFLLLAWLLAACLGFLMILRRFFEPVVSVLREAAQNLRRSEPERAAAAAETETAAEAKAEAAAPAPGAAAGFAPERALPFSFIKEGDLPALGMMLAEQADVDSAIVIQYLPPALASRALSSLTALKRERVLGFMSVPALLSHGDVKRLEDSVLAKIDYIMGGEEKLAAILDQASISMQAEILSAVRKRDPELGRRLDRRVVVLEDIAQLDENALSALSRRATVRSLAAVLKYSSRLRDRVLPKLKGGLGEWLTQETALIGDLSEQAKEAEMQRVLQALVKLVREGKIALRKDAPAPSPLPPAAAAPAPLPAARPKMPAAGGK
jgi:flagellar motor switch protein FliG